MEVTDTAEILFDNADDKRRVVRAVDAALATMDFTGTTLVVLGNEVFTYPRMLYASLDNDFNRRVGDLRSKGHQIPPRGTVVAVIESTETRVRLSDIGRIK